MYLNHHRRRFVRLRPRVLRETADFFNSRPLTNPKAKAKRLLGVAVALAEGLTRSRMRRFSIKDDVVVLGVRDRPRERVPPVVHSCRFPARNRRDNRRDADWRPTASVRRPPPPGMATSLARASARVRECARAARRARLSARVGVRRAGVPTDVWSNAEPEAVAANALKTLFTQAAVRLVLAQEEGYDNEGAPTELSRALSDWLHEHPLARDGDGWLSELLRAPNSATLRFAGLRILEARAAYAKEDFRFEKLREEAIKRVIEANDALMVEYVERSMNAV